MAVDRHNCAGGDCERAAALMREAVTAWRDAVIDMLPEVLATMVHELKDEVMPDEKFARLVWARILKGNAEGAADGETLPPNIDGFSFDTSGTVGEYTGADGPQQSAEEAIFSLPNGLQGGFLRLSRQAIQLT